MQIKPSLCKLNNIWIYMKAEKETHGNARGVKDRTVSVQKHNGSIQFFLEASWIINMNSHWNISWLQYHFNVCIWLRNFCDNIAQSNCQYFTKPDSRQHWNKHLRAAAAAIAWTKKENEIARKNFLVTEIPKKLLVNKFRCKYFILHASPHHNANRVEKCTEFSPRSNIVIEFSCSWPKNTSSPLNAKLNAKLPRKPN